MKLRELFHKQEYHLENVRDRNRQDPRHFLVPTHTEIASLKEGDLVRLHFVFNRKRQDNCRAERIWVSIDSKRGDDAFIGVLDNEPAFLESIRCGDPIQFKSDHITSIFTKGKIGFNANLMAIVTKRALEKQQIDWVIRSHHFHNEKDSGWQLFYGDESAEYLNDSKNSTLISLDQAMDIEPLLEPVFAGTHHAYEFSKLDNCFVESDFAPDN